jgi:Holliday junction resolvasome RuvABC endonuclease subunit
LGKPERILALDTSTKTGWSLIVSDGKDFTLEANGQIDAMKRPDDIPYPEQFLVWAEKCFERVEWIIDNYKPDVLVIEETSSGSKNNYDQKILEWIHFLLASKIKRDSIKAVYVMSEQWRRETGCKMTKEESKHNKDVKKYKEANDTNIAYDANGKRIGRLTRKHINIRRANEVFSKYLKEPLRKKDEDTADSLLLGYCYHLRKVKNE